jgi:cytochrome b6-f complex iron-sulfur subunit
MADRITFLKQAGALTLLGCCGGLTALLEGCKTTSIKFEVTEKQIKVERASVDAAKNGYVILRDDRIAFPICISRDENGTYTAIPLVCTHKGCELDAAGTRLVCPCHGSEFSIRGEVLSSPAEVDIARFPISEREGQLILTFAP